MAAEISGRLARSWPLRLGYFKPVSVSATPAVSIGRAQPKVVELRAAVSKVVEMRAAA